MNIEFINKNRTILGGSINNGSDMLIDSTLSRVGYAADAAAVGEALADMEEYIDKATTLVMTDDGEGNVTLTTLMGVPLNMLDDGNGNVTILE